MTSTLAASSISDLAAQFAAGTDPVALTEECLQRIETFRDYGAFVDVDTKGALEAARESRERWRSGKPLSPLDGVPIGAKSNIAIAGLPHTAGIAAYRGVIAEADAPVIAAYRSAGAVILGSLAMHEAAFGATTDNPAYGRCHNPWRFGYTPGGSSGGSAAAVALGLCAGALGTDTMGSVRLPSSYCGVFGHKPGFDTIPAAGVVPLSWTLDHVGVHARSAQDCVAMLAPFRSTVPARPGLIAAVSLDGLELERDVAEAFASTLDRARSLGMEIAETALPLNGATLRRSSLLIVEAEAAAVHAEKLETDSEGFSEGFRSALAWACRQPIPKLALAHQALIEARRTLRAAWAEFDAVLLPTTPQTAFAFDAPVPAGQADLTIFANVLGCPATAFPVGLSADGLPLSVQALSWGDESALWLAEQLGTPLGLAA